MKVKRILLFEFSVILLIFHSCSGKGVESSEQQTEINSAFLSTIKTAKAVLSNQQEELILAGKVEYDPDKVINYVPLVSGIIDRSHFSLGDKVQKGQSLLDIRSSDLSSMQMEYISYESEVKVAEREMKTITEMFDDKMLSEKELLETQARLKQAQASFDKVKNDLIPYGQNDNGTFSIKAPMSGYIVDKKAAAGSPVSMDSDPLFVVADLSSVWIIANVYASNVQFVKEGMAVDITTLSYPDEIFPAKINRVSQVFDSEEKVLKARIVMPNNDLKLKPEMSVVARLKNEANEKTIAVPSDALIFDDNRYFVVIKNSQEDFQVREVKLQGHNGSTSYIRSGLLENEEVVINNQLLIYSGLNKK